MNKDNLKKTSSLKIASDTSARSAPKEALLEAVTRFLQGHVGSRSLIPINNITSPDLGTSDLALINKDHTRLMIVQLQKEEAFSSFAFVAAAYHSWLQDWFRIKEEAFNRSMVLDTVLVSHGAPPAESYLMKVLSQMGLFAIIKYQMLNIEEMPTPVIRFEFQDMRSNRQAESNNEENRKDAFSNNIEEDKIASRYRLTPIEMDAFHQLQDRYMK